jgi:hypothetical protein
VRAPERLDGLRIVARPEAIEHAYYEGDVITIRIAPDEVFAVGAVAVEISDEHAIIERETAFVGWGLSDAEFQRHVARHIEWSLPLHRPALAQGLAAAVPIKLWFDYDRVLLISSSGLAHEVAERFGLPPMGLGS